MNKTNFKIPDFDFEFEGAKQSAPTSSRRELLESSKLSRLPERKPFSLEGVSSPKPRIACVNCKTTSVNETEFLQAIRACRKCLQIYAVILQAIEAAEQRKRRETLKRFVSTTGR